MSVFNSSGYYNALPERGALHNKYLFLTDLETENSKIKKLTDAWVVQMVKCLTLDFVSGLYLMVAGSTPTSGVILSAECRIGLRCCLPSPTHYNKKEEADRFAILLLYPNMAQ